MTDPRDRNSAALPVSWPALLLVLCGLWLGSILYFLAHAQRANSIRAAAQRIRIDELEARRAEKDFLMRSLSDESFYETGGSEYLDRHREHVADLRATIGDLRARLVTEEAARPARLLRLVDEYERGFRDLVSALRTRGYGNVGLVAKRRRALEELRAVGGTTGDPALEMALVRLDAEDRALATERLSALPRSLDAALEEVRGASAQVARRTAERPLQDVLAEYEATLRATRDLEATIGSTEDQGLLGELRRAIHAVEPAVAEVLDAAIAADESAQRTLRVGVGAACLIMVVLLALAAAFARTARRQSRRLLETNRRMEAEHQKLLRAERLAAIGEMVAGLAHESRNAFQRTHACLDMLSHEVRDRPEATALVSRIEESQDQLHFLYEQVREYAAPIQLERVRTDIGDIVERTWENLELRRASRDARLEHRRLAADLELDIDRFAMEQVFRNILENALAASADPVRIVASYRDEVDRSALVVAVRDDGPGLSDEQRERIFDPFFTTKTRGTGLGMAIVRRLVEAHGGTIEVGAPDGPGAEIVIRLPRTQERSRD